MRTTALTFATICSAAAPALLHAQGAPDPVVVGAESFERRVLAGGLEGPWELLWGPDDHLWVTERSAGRVTRINPEDGAKSPAITIEDVLSQSSQDGLLGMALHPDLLQGAGDEFVYVAYTYLDEERGIDPTVMDPESPFRHVYAKIVRLTYDEETETLGAPQDLIVGLPASNDHNAGRLKIGPDGKLYYSVGDQGNNQLGNWCVPIASQVLPTREEVERADWTSYVGKSLRLNLDGSIPDDNPEIAGVVSHVYTYGHRNMQGFDFAPDGTLYASEQGPKSDDEINVLEPGGNYGWPHVSGFQDDLAYVDARWADSSLDCERLTFSDLEIDPSVPWTAESDWSAPANHREPLATMFTVPSDHDFSDPRCEGMDYICWPTVAPSSLEVYAPEENGIPGWGKSLLIPTLKHGSLYRVALNGDGSGTEGPFHRYFRSENRLRDTAVGPDHRTIYVATDPKGPVEALSGGATMTLEHPGAILALSYQGNGEAR